MKKNLLYLFELIYLVVFSLVQLGVLQGINMVYLLLGLTVISFVLIVANIYPSLKRDWDKGGHWLIIMFISLTAMIYTFVLKTLF